MEKKKKKSKGGRALVATQNGRGSSRSGGKSSILPEEGPQEE